MPTTSYSTWDFYNYRVQQESRMGQFVSAESTLVAAGPPLASQTSGGGTRGGVYPIGLLESVGVQQSKQLQRIFEIGSSRSYFIPGRVIGSFSIGRTFFFGPSLLRVLYAYYRNEANNIEIGTEAPGTVKEFGEGFSFESPQAALLDNLSAADMHALKRSPGEDYFFVDLASDLFNQPMGLAIYFKDANFFSVGAMYLQECYIQGHQMSISSGSVLIMEGVSAQFEKIVPIKVIF
jgi:hypothetical protein